MREVQPGHARLHLAEESPPCLSAPSRRSRIRSARLRDLAVAALLGLSGSVAGAGAQEPDDNPLLRWQYFHEQRAFPGTTIPAGALLRARQQMRDRWPELFLPRTGDRTSAFALSTSAWTPIGPAPISNGSAGRVSTVAVHPGDPAVVYIGGAQGGVWRTGDGGLTWSALTDNECSLAMGSIAIDPVDPRILYAGTGELHFSGDSYYGCGVLRSTDEGASWTRLGETAFASSTGGARISRLIIDPATAGSTSTTTIYAASSNGLWISHNSGLSWMKTLDGVISDLQLDGASSRTLYAAVGLPSTAETSGIFRSDNYGNTWTKLTAFPPTDVGRIALGASPVVGGTVYAAVQNGFNNGTNDGRLLGIWRTTDGGASWTQRTATQADCGTQCWYDLVIAVDPVDPDRVWFGGVPLFRSTDGAQTFQNVLRNAHVDQHAITFDPTDPGTVYIGNDGGVYRSRDGATSWQSLNAGLSITQFYAGISLHPTDTTVVLGGTQDNGTLEARGDEIWFSVLGADGGFTAIDYENPTYAWAETQWTSGSGFAGPRIRIGSGSFERRVTGIDTNDRALFIPPLVMDRTDPATLYFGTYRVYRTTSRGVLWGAISPDLTQTTNGRVSAIAPAESDPRTLWVGTTDGAIQVTRDAGVTWNLRNGGLPARYVTDIVVDGANPDIAVASVSGFGTGHVFRTTNGGVAWIDISGGLPDVPVNAVLTDPALGNALYVGTDLGVFRTFDNGDSWEPFGDGLPHVAIYDLTYNRGTGIAVAATHGRSVFAFKPSAASFLAIAQDSIRFESVGDTARLTAVGLDLTGDTIPDLVPAWRSSDDAVTSVDSRGLLTATGNGEAVIHAAFAGAMDSTIVIVRQMVADIADLPRTLDLVQGEARLVPARPVDALGQAIPGAVIAWSSSDPGIATVDPDGTIHAVGTGDVDIVAAVDNVRDSTAVSVVPPSTATVSAIPAVVATEPRSAAGTALPLLSLEVAVSGLESMRIGRLDFTVRGIDPRATVTLIRDANGNGSIDPTEAGVVSIPVNLAVGETADIALEPTDMIVGGGETERFILAIRLSGDSPNGASFQATWLPQSTSATGVRSGAGNRLSLPQAPVASATITSTVLGADEILTFSENPVRSDRVIFNFREPPARAAVYTVTGRLVIDLTQHIQQGNRIDWDLRNGDGERVAPGVYLVIFDVAGTVMRERLIVIPRDGPVERETGGRAWLPPPHQASASRSYVMIRSHSSASERATTATTGSDSLRL